MRKLLLVGCLCLGSAALAADGAQGDAAFRHACSRCHTATQFIKNKPPPPQKNPRALRHMGPDLSVIWRRSGATAFRRWVKNPWSVRASTACDPRLLAPTQLEDLIAFLTSKAQPALPPPVPASPGRRP